jgi:Hydrazine synthase alpha subunit middle domain
MRSIGSLFAGWLLVSCLEPADQILESYGEGRMVFVKSPSVGGQNMNRDVAMAANPDEFHPGTDLMLLAPISPTGKLTNLTEQWTRSRDNQNDWGAAQDPEASFDGNKILFSMRKAGARYDAGHPRFTVWEMNADGSNLVQVTYPKDYDDMDPAYIDDDHIVFASTKNQILDEYERRIVPQLFVTERGGDGKFSEPRQITFNQSHDQNPFVHSSGKIYYTRWDHLGNPNKMPLFTVNPDGTGQFVLFGADENFSQGNTSGSRTFMEARELRDGGIVASIMERTSEFEGGAICIIDISKFSSAPTIITPSGSPYNNTQKASDAIFKTPYPIMDGGVEKILVAESAHETGGDTKNGVVNYDIFIMDKTGGTPRLVHADPSNNDYDPVVLAPRAFTPKPYQMNPLVKKAIDGGLKTGTFFDANVYSRQNDGQPRGTDLDGKARFVRVLGAIGTPSGCNMCGQTMGHTQFERQHVIGYGDVRADGSFSIEVPANTPMHVQTLDEDGVMLVNQLQWINVMPGEQRMCTGCHGPRDHDADITHFSIDGTDSTVKFDLGTVQKFLSGFNNADKTAEHPSVRQAILDFHTIGDSAAAKTTSIQGIFDNRCNSCHGASSASDKGGNLVLETSRDTSFTNHGTTDVYERLTEGNHYLGADGKTNLDYANSDGARRSPLAWVMFNRQLGNANNSNNVFRKPSYNHSEMWEKDSTSGKIKVFSEKNADLLAMIEWMDMGVQFMNSVPKK